METSFGVKSGVLGSVLQGGTFMPCAAHLGRGILVFTVLRQSRVRDGEGPSGAAWSPYGPGCSQLRCRIQTSWRDNGRGTPRSARRSCRSAGGIARKDFHESYLGTAGLRVPGASRLRRIREHPARAIRTPGVPTGVKLPSEGRSWHGS